MSVGSVARDGRTYNEIHDALGTSEKPQALCRGDRRHAWGEGGGGGEEEDEKNRRRRRTETEEFQKAGTKTEKGKRPSDRPAASRFQVEKTEIQTEIQTVTQENK